MKSICLKLKNKLSGQAGFSLIEVLIAMAVLSIGLLSIAAMQTSAIKGNAKSNNLTQRTFTASSHIEYLLNIPFTHPDLTDGTHTQTIDGDTYTWTVTTPAARPSERIISLTLTNTYYGENRILTMNTKRVRNQ